MAIRCGDNPVLEFLDPVSGQVTASTDLANLLGTPSGTPQFSLGTACPWVGFNQPSAARLHVRELFDGAFTRVAVVDNEDFSDGSRHVGYLDIATGAFTDVTAKVESGGFSAHVPIDSNPLFDPATDEFWFLRDTGEIFAVDPGTGQSEVRAQTKPGGLNGISGQTPSLASFVLAPRSDSLVGGYPPSGDLAGAAQPDNDEVLPNPSGALAATDMIRLNGTPGQIGLFTTLADTLSKSADDQASLASKAQVVNVDGGPPANFLAGVGDHCVPLAWVNDGLLVCESFAGSGNPQLAVVQVAAGEDSASTTLLLPASERTNYDPVVSPDGGTIAFLSSQGTTLTLYTEPADSPGAEPTKVADLETTFDTNLHDLDILEWD